MLAAEALNVSSRQRVAEHLISTLGNGGSSREHSECEEGS